MAQHPRARPEGGTGTAVTRTSGARGPGRPEATAGRRRPLRLPASLASAPRWRAASLPSLALAAACLGVVLLPRALFAPGSTGYATAAEASHAVLLILLALVGLRMPLALGLGVAVGAEAVLAAQRIAWGDSPTALVLVWALLGPALVGATWTLSEHHRSVARAGTRAAVVALARAIEANHEGTGEHSGEVVDLAVAVGGRLGLRGHELEDLALAAHLHDVGKIGVPREVLDKPGPLDAAEIELMRRHPDIGADLVAQVPALAGVAASVRAMHERVDGGGYPRGLAGEEIPLSARIVFCCDAYSAMRQERAYKPAMDRRQAVAELERCAGTQFDAAVVRVLVQVLAEAEAAERRAAPAGRPASWPAGVAAPEAAE